MKKVFPLMLTLVVAVLLSSALAQSNKLNFFTWPEYIDPDIITQFEEEFDAEVVVDLFDSNEEALETLMEAIEKAGEKPGDRVVITLDVAASEFGKNGQYRLALDGRDMDNSAMIDLLGKWVQNYPIASIEDPLGEDDTEGMTEFTRRFGDRIQIIGDDYLVTNPDLVKAAAHDGACNSVLIKVNQIGTVSEAIATFQAAQQSGWQTVISARSGETEDVSISHLATGLAAGQLKVGSFTRTERMAKWNECIRIEEALGPGAFVGGSPLKNTWWGKLNT